MIIAIQLTGLIGKVFTSNGLLWRVVELRASLAMGRLLPRRKMRGFFAALRMTSRKGCCGQNDKLQDSCAQHDNSQGMRGFFFFDRPRGRRTSRFPCGRPRGKMTSFKIAALRMTIQFRSTVLFYQAEGNYYANYFGLFFGWKWFGLCLLMDFGGGVGG